MHSRNDQTTTYLLREHNDETYRELAVQCTPRRQQTRVDKYVAEHKSGEGGHPFKQGVNLLTDEQH